MICVGFGAFASVCGESFPGTFPALQRHQDVRYRFGDAFKRRKLPVARRPFSGEHRARGAQRTPMSGDITSELPTRAEAQRTAPRRLIFVVAMPYATLRPRVSAPLALNVSRGMSIRSRAHAAIAQTKILRAERVERKVQPLAHRLGVHRYWERNRRRLCSERRPLDPHDEARIGVTI